MALPTLVLVLAVALAAVDLGLAQVRCVDAARLGARLLARGESEGSALSAARAAAPDGASIAVSTSGSRVTVVVTGTVPATLQAVGALPTPVASAQALLEVAP